MAIRLECYTMRSIEFDDVLDRSDWGVVLVEIGLGCSRPAALCQRRNNRRDGVH